MPSIKLLILLVLAGVISGAACRRSAVESNANSNAANSNAAAEETSSTPPFQTKEPERYQATMSINGDLGQQAQSIPGLSSSINREMFIARDGDKRRVESEILAGIKVAFLQLPTGRY
ncbi:MAG: hypothetical protein JO360_12840, partial [Acidobacteria bacterium]|nr:hypothetical protein [Acidobacteriota bacterium]